MNVGKKFHWDAAHRLPHHAGKCRSLHGHSYYMTVELQGVADDSGMVMDFQQLKAIVKPLVDSLDHATLVADSDAELLYLLQTLESRYFVLPSDTTAENLCLYVADYICREGAPQLEASRVEMVRVRINETESCYAECEMPFRSRMDWVAAGDVKAQEQGT